MKFLYSIVALMHYSLVMRVYRSQCIMLLAIFYCLQNYSESAGDTWNSFSASHGGLGVWNVATNEKISIEFVSNNYVGTLMPNLDPNRKALSWNNSGSIVITSPLVENDWNRATVVSE